MAELDLYGDTDTHEKQARRKHRLLMLVILVMAVVVAPAAIRIFGQIEHQLQKTGVAASDNRTWVIAQLEVDLTKLLLAVAQARGAEEPATMLDELRLQFDVLYSRVLLLKTSAILQGIGLESLDEWHYLSGEGGLLDRLVPLFDGSDEGLVAALPTLAAEFGALQPPIRVAVVEAVNEVMKDDDLLRRELRDLLRWFAGAMLWILSGMAILMAVLFLQSRNRTKQARDLEIALQNLRTTMTAALDAVMIINAQERVVAANRATTSLFGGAVACLRPKLSDILRRPDSGPVTRAELLPGARVRMQGVRLDGTLFPAEVSIGSGQTAGGRAITVVFLRDISEQIAHEESLAQARNAAMEADEAKARFLAVMSHEMRTPLTGLLSAVDLLERTTKLDQTQAWLTDTIRTCGGIALEQVNNVLHLSRMNDASAGDYPVTAFPIARAVKDIARSFDSDAARNGTVIELAGLEGEDIGVLLPLQVLRRSLGNLLSNAVKFTDEGLIRVELSHAPAERAGWVALRISVQDTGIGIDRKDLDRIFRNFETLDSSYSRVREGSGLGLGIAKLAVEQMGGHIETESEVGRGSRFTIFIEAPLAPLPVAAVEEDAAIPERPLGGVSLLLAEDNPINRTLMARQLESLGAQVTTAVDGQDAVEKARGSLFDVILMDVAMLPIVRAMSAWPPPPVPCRRPRTATPIGEPSCGFTKNSPQSRPSCPPEPSAPASALRTCWRTGVLTTSSTRWTRWMRCWSACARERTCPAPCGRWGGWSG